VRILIFGASGMVGQGVLRECLQSPDVEEVVCVVRATLPQAHPKLTQVQRNDVGDLSGVDLAAFDACFFPLGVSSAGMDEAAYRVVTHDLTLGIARQLAAANPAMTFVSGAGSNAQGRAMWARVKGQTENDLLALLANAYALRPGIIRALDGIRSRTPLYRRFYVVLAPIIAVASKLAPSRVVTTRTIGQAMLNLARRGDSKHILEAKDINEAAQTSQPANTQAA